MRNQSADDRVLIARLPRSGFVPALLLTCIVMGPGLLNPRFATGWFFALFCAVAIIWRSSQLRLEVTNHAVVVTNFFRTIHVPVDEARLNPDQTKTGYLEILGRSGKTIHVGAAPAWSGQLENIRERLSSELARRRNN